MDYASPERHVMEELGGSDFEASLGMGDLGYGTHFTPDMDTSFDPTSGMAGLGCGCSAVPAMALNGLGAAPNPFMPYTPPGLAPYVAGPNAQYQKLYAPNLMPPAKKTDSNQWMWILLGLVAAYLVYQYVMKNKQAASGGAAPVELPA